jgi:ribosome recycling factor
MKNYKRELKELTWKHNDQQELQSKIEVLKEHYYESLDKTISESMKPIIDELDELKK